MKITDQYIRSILIFNKQYILASLYELKTTEDNFWFNVYGAILSIEIQFFIPFLYKYILTTHLVKLM